MEVESSHHQLVMLGKEVTTSLKRSLFFYKMVKIIPASPTSHEDCEKLLRGFN